MWHLLLGKNIIKKRLGNIIWNGNVFCLCYHTYILHIYILFIVQILHNYNGHVQYYGLLHRKWSEVLYVCCILPLGVMPKAVNCTAQSNMSLSVEVQQELVKAFGVKYHMIPCCYSLSILVFKNQAGTRISTDFFIFCGGHCFSTKCKNRYMECS